MKIQKLTVIIFILIIVGLTGFYQVSADYYSQSPYVPKALVFTSATSGESPLTVSFSDYSTNNPTYWNWDFGDGTGSSIQNPTHTYNAPGVYTYSLTVGNSYGAVKAIYSNSIGVNKPSENPPYSQSGGQNINLLPNWLDLNVFLILFLSLIIAGILWYTIKKRQRKREKYRAFYSSPGLKPNRKRNFDIGGAIVLTLIIVVFAAFFSNLFFPFILSFNHQDMNKVIGNPKSLYFYDICSSCDKKNENNIVSALDYLSSVSEVKFVRLPEPVALVLGGIEYSCGGGLSNIGASGESSSGFGGFYIFYAVMNQIKLVSTDKEVILHETLHSMGFDHSKDPKSIMYPIQRGNNQIDPDIVEFIKTYYVYNPFGYLNIISLNIIALGIGCFIPLIIFGSGGKR